MVQGKLKVSWRQTAWLTAAIVNSGFGRTKAVSYQDCDPYDVKPERDVFDELDGLLGLE